MFSNTKRYISAFLVAVSFLNLCSCEANNTERSTNDKETIETETAENDTFLSDTTDIGDATEIGDETNAPNDVAKINVDFIGLTDSDGNVLDGTKYSIKNKTVCVEIPFALNEKAVRYMKACVEGDGTKIVAFTDMDENDVTELSFREKYIITIANKQNVKKYYFTVKRQTNRLPVVSLYTENECEIASKLEYVNGAMSVDCSGDDAYAGCDTYELALKVKGRGNASWWQSDKKSYRIKLDKKISILGLPADRDWVLVPNYYDKSLIRNAVAHKMAQQMEYLYYTPTHIPVDLFLNGEYRGVYSLADKIEVADKKIVIGDTEKSDDFGFLIEMGWNYNEDIRRGKDYFDTEMLERLFVKEPEITERYNDKIKYIMNYVQKTENAIKSGKGYEEYIDMNAFVDWFIITELTNNTEMAFYRSCYFYKPAGGKLIMGPVWDFDMAFGNHKGDIKNYDGWASGEATYYEMTVNWATYLVKNEMFMNLVRERWLEKRDVLLKCANEAIDYYSDKVEASQNENFKLWNIMDKQTGLGNVDYEKYDTYELQVQYLREFVSDRAEWIDNELRVSKNN